MPHSGRISAALLLLVAGDEIVFDPAPDLAVVETVQCDLRLELERVGFGFRGEYSEYGSSGIGAETTSRKVQLVLRDEYSRIGGNRPERVQRRFARVALRSEQIVEGVTSRAESTSPLSGKQVLVEWDPDAEDYAVSYGPQDRFQDESLLDGLPCDFDLHGILPGRAEAPGGYWFVDAAALHGVFSLDRLPFEKPEADCAPEIGLGDCDGELRVDYVEQFFRGSARIARLRISGEMEREVLLQTLESHFHIGLGYTTESVVDHAVRERFEVEGSVSWSLDENRWDEFELNVELELETTETGFWGDSEVVHRTGWSGRAEFKGVSEAAVSAAPDELDG